jgi:hypothetical protein
VSGSNPVNATVTAGNASTANFAVSCAATTGSIDVSVTTSGVDQDADGYTVQLDAGTPQAIGINGSTSFTSVSPGGHTVTLAGLATNCTVSGSNPVNPTVTAGNASTASFAVSCTTTMGSIDVSTTTTGVEQDTDGYTVQLEAGTPQAIAINASTSFASVTPGSRSVTLADLATNCTVSGANPLNVAVTAGNAAAADFAVVCAATTGTLRVTANTTGVNLDLNGFTLALDAGATQALAANGDTLTFSGQMPGAHTTVLDSIAPNCSVAGTSTHTPTVTAGATTLEVYDVTCTL